MIVVDASAVLEVLLQTPAGAGISRRMFPLGETLHAPHLLDLEVAHVLRRYARSGHISPQPGSPAAAGSPPSPKGEGKKCRKLQPSPKGRCEKILARGSAA